MRISVERHRRQAMRNCHTTWSSRTSHEEHSERLTGDASADWRVKCCGRSCDRQCMANANNTRTTGREPPELVRLAAHSKRMRNCRARGAGPRPGRERHCSFHRPATNNDAASLLLSHPVCREVCCRASSTAQEIPQYMVSDHVRDLNTSIWVYLGVCRRLLALFEYGLEEDSTLATTRAHIVRHDDASGAPRVQGLW